MLKSKRMNQNSYSPQITQIYTDLHRMIFNLLITNNIYLCNQW